jgi:ribosomal protein L23
MGGGKNSQVGPKSILSGMSKNAKRQDIHRAVDKLDDLTLEQISTIILDKKDGTSAKIPLKEKAAMVSAKKEQELEAFDSPEVAEEQFEREGE